MASISTQLHQILQSVDCPGDFYVSGKLEAFPPQLEVEGVGRIALPLLPLQIEALIAAAERAPYGRGQETLVDTDVRRTWQIDASHIHLGGKHWQRTLECIVSRTALGLGVNDKVDAELYKMLVYDTGSFFVSHRDTEKAPGMFATLVIVLPCEYSGGKLVVRHQQQEAHLDLRCTDLSEIAYAAFYADCLHEILPITDGCRLALIYNLVRSNKKLPLPTPPDFRHEQQTVAALLRDWSQQLDQDNAEAEIPEKLLYLLDHAYTQAELSFAALKNTDAAIADVLAAAAELADCDIHLALVSVEESGNAEYSGGGGYWDDDDLEVGEVIDRLETVADWRRLDGSETTLPRLPFFETEFCPPEAFATMEFDEVQFQEATGNAGASFERTYHGAALVIWPRHRYLAIINQAGFSEALQVLQGFCQSEDMLDGDKENACRLAGYMLRDGLPYVMQSYGNDERLRDYLACLHRLQDSPLAAQFWSLFSEMGIYHKNNCASLVQIAGLLPWAQAVQGLESAVNTSISHNAQATCAALLAQFARTYPDNAHDLGKAAWQLLAALPGDAARFQHLKPWEYSRLSADDALVTDVLVAFSSIDASLADTALDYILAWPDTYQADAVLVPAALTLTATESSRNLPVAIRLRETVLAHLQKRVAEDLSPPADQRRDSQLKCRCQDCTELGAFLDNPTQARWQFKAAENRRAHVEQTIKTARSDVDCRTEKLNRPYTLVCTKNQASYQRRVQQREADLVVLARLGA
jgi:predicted 2-oxoglutarate/Fe(II)-dependent dioxygenase YbiX